jgi:osmoprotectant transport system permease protein
MNQSELAKQLALLPDYLGSHLLLSVAAMGIGILVCLPLAIVVTRVKWLQWPVLTFAGVMQTVPGIALLALMVPLLGQIGFLPAFIALVLYSMLPIIRNTVTGILGVDATLIEAARGVGMTDMQQLLHVELPLALPVMIAGIRTATVWVVGTATLSTPVGATSLGNYIFGGLQTQNFTAVLVGCIAAATLAIVLDQLIRLMEVAASKRNRRLAWSAGFFLLLLASLGFLPSLMKLRTATPAPLVVVGAKTFTEQYILSEAISRKLADAGFNTAAKPGLGSTIIFDALAANSIDCYVDYSGTIWTTIMKRDETLPRERVLEEMQAWLRQRYSITLLGTLGFENTYALTLSRQRAAQLKIGSMDELAMHAPQLTIGSDYEFFGRPEWASLKQKYHLRFAQQRTFDPSLMYAAVKERKVDVISAYSTDGRIVAYDLLVLPDPKQALPPYDAVLLLSPRASANVKLAQALKPFIHGISNETMRQANNLVDVEKQSVTEAASYILRSLMRDDAIK